LRYQQALQQADRQDSGVAAALRANLVQQEAVDYARRRFGETPIPSARRADSAAAKAEALLRERLGEAEWSLFQTTRTLTRRSRLWPDVLYRVRTGEPVQAIRDGQLAALLCVVARHGEPEADCLLTILDLIDTDERRLWEMANLTHLAPHQPTERRMFWFGLVLTMNLGAVLFLGVFWLVKWLAD